MKKWEWEPCDCKDVFVERECGCGEECCRLYRDKTIHWLGKHWRLACAFDHATMLLEEREQCTDLKDAK